MHKQWGLLLKEEAEKDTGRPENISQAKAVYREKCIDAHICVKIAQIHNTAVYSKILGKGEQTTIKVNRRQKNVAVSKLYLKHSVQESVPVLCSAHRCQRTCALCPVMALESCLLPTAPCTTPDHVRNLSTSLSEMKTISTSSQRFMSLLPKPDSGTAVVRQ